MNSQAGQAYRNITKRVMNQEVPLLNLDYETGIVKKLKRLLGLKG